MRKMVYVCDICGQQKENPEDVFFVRDAGEDYDVCTDCIEWLIKQHFSAKAPDPVQETEEAEVQPVKVGKEPDCGKAQALRDAGWKVGDIAEELGVTKQSVYNHTVAPENRRKFPLEEIGSLQPC